jgi:hypothetical protein
VYHIVWNMPMGAEAGGLTTAERRLGAFDDRRAAPPAPIAIKGSFQ